MDRFNTSAGSASAPVAPTAPDNPYFTSGNPGLGVPATVPGPYWFHMISEEIRNVIFEAGLTPDHENLTQLYEAIQTMIDANVGPDASETVKGIAELATTAEAQALTNDSRIITPLKLANAFKGSNQSLAANGYQKLPGGLILQWTHVTGNGTSLYPIAFPNAALAVYASVDTPNFRTCAAFIVDASSFTHSAFQGDGAATALEPLTIFAIGY